MTILYSVSFCSQLISALSASPKASFSQVEMLAFVLLNGQEVSPDLNVGESDQVNAWRLQGYQILLRNIHKGSHDYQKYKKRTRP